ncbi:uncharacterized protein LOC128240121 [Mya arenaria]|uniref:uncharacterized protein LOC128240121 n=1 Tax=Mya arenaria TaxID=6604 RepID=UPI0022DF1394|nr:uncharacterized protein LOC128240121 [Mya arenaria]
MDGTCLRVKDVMEKLVSTGILNTTKFLQSMYDNESSQKYLFLTLRRLQQKCYRLQKNEHRVKGKENLQRFLNLPYHIPTISNDCRPCILLEKQHLISQCPVNNAESVEDFIEGPVCPNEHRPIFDECPTTSVKHPTVVGVIPPISLEEKDVSTSKTFFEDLSSNLEDLKIQTIETQSVIEQTKELNRTLFETLQNRNEQLNINKKELKRTNSRENYWRNKCQKLEDETSCLIIEDPCSCDLNERLDSLQAEIKIMKNINSDLNKQIDELKIEVETLKDRENCIFYNEHTNSYSPELHVCVYSLLNCNVGTEHVVKVIESVLNLINKTADKLPSVSTINNWSVERNLISREHISSKKNSKHITLHTDEASKYGHRYGSFATRDVDGNYMVLGMRDMTTKSSHDTLETFKEILCDIDCLSSDQHPSGKTILCNIKNTMSDRAATEVKFNDLLQNYKNEVLPEIVENYQDLNGESQQALGRINNFFCGLHSLVHMAEVSQKVLYDVEDNHFDGNIPHSNTCFNKVGQSGTLRLIQTSCKAFARRGDQRNGCYGNFKTFISSLLQEHAMNFPLQPLKGNRFNILFANAGHIYFLHKHIHEFLKSYPNLNFLLSSILKDIQEPFFIAGCKALGLLSKFLTTPLWHVIENKDISISDINIRYFQLKTFLEDSALNINDFMKGKHTLFDDVPVKKDSVYQCLIEENPVDGHVTVMLSVLLPALSKLISKQFKDHLPSGVHEHVDANETASVDKHNKFPERIFSYVDHILSYKPNITTLSLESHITFSLNKTLDWLKEQPDINTLIEKSRKSVKDERKQFKRRELAIEASRLKKLQNDMIKKEEMERKRIQKLEILTTSLHKYGLWMSTEEINQGLSKIRLKKEQENSLKTQLKYRKEVLNQKNSDKLFAVSKVVNSKRVLLTVEDLKANLIRLIQL